MYIGSPNAADTQTTSWYYYCAAVDGVLLLLYLTLFSILSPYLRHSHPHPPTFTVHWAIRLSLGLSFYFDLAYPGRSFAISNYTTLAAQKHPTPNHLPTFHCDHWNLRLCKPWICIYWWIIRALNTCIYIYMCIYLHTERINCQVQELMQLSKENNFWWNFYWHWFSFFLL